MSGGESVPVDDRARDRVRARPNAWPLALALVAPALAAVVFTPGFLTQDGPAHLYNAQILRESIRNSSSPLLAVFEVRWLPLPNWAGHALLVALLDAGLPPSVSNRVSIGLTLLCPIAAVLWLRRRVQGSPAPPEVLALAILLGLNIAWLFGFSSFLLGLSLGFLTLGVWWAGRDRLTAWRAGAVAALLVVGYFAHLISLAMTLLGLAILALATPASAETWTRRLLLTIASLVPVTPLLLWYQAQMAAGGPIQPTWWHLVNPISLDAWKAQLGWVDPISLAGKLAIPFSAQTHPLAVAFSPAAWLMLGLLALVIASRGVPLRGERRGWSLLALVLCLAGVLGPDALGSQITHGAYLTQRLLLMGLFTLVVILDPAASRPRVRGAALLCLAMALGLQTLFVWDYARSSSHVAAPFQAARSRIAQPLRIATLWITPRQRFRSNPLLHADCLLGVGTDAIIWNNYEAAQYYFPVRVRPEVPHPPIALFERISIRDAPWAASDRAESFRRLLADHGQQIDALTTWGHDERLEQIARRGYRPAFSAGPLRLWVRRDAADSSNPTAIVPAQP